MFESSESVQIEEENAGGSAAAIPTDSATSGPRRSTRESRQPDRFMAGAALGADEEPRTFKEAMSSPQASEWKLAMDEEMTSLLENGTWTIEALPPGAKALPVKWVYKVKRGTDGRLERYKARLVVQGFRQVPGVDFNEVYAPVSKHTTLRVLLATAAAQDLELDHLDVKTAFLNGEIEEVIYIRQPPGYESGDPNLVCRLNKSLYGLKQAPRAWNQKLTAELEKLGFKPSEADPAFFVLQEDGDTVYLLVYVDDLLLGSKSPIVLSAVKSRLMRIFDMRDLGPVSQFLGMSISRDRVKRTLSVSQAGMARSIVSKFGMTSARPRSTPVDSAIKLVPAQSEEEFLDTTVYPYAELIGALLYISVCTRPDLTQAVNMLARFMAKPTKLHWDAAMSVLRYLCKSGDVGIVYGGGDSVDEPVAYSDADYASDLTSRRSTTGYVFVVNGGAVSWMSKLQPTVAVSTAEAEYMAASAAVKEALWMRKLLPVFGLLNGPLVVFTDNQAALSLVKHPITSALSKHIDIMQHFARERVARGEVTFIYCPTAEMVADFLTKPVPLPKFRFCCKALGLSPAY